MFDVIFVTYKSMMTVSTRRVCAPGTQVPHHTSPAMCTCCECGLACDTCVSVFPPNPVWWTCPLNAVLLVSPWISIVTIMSPPRGFPKVRRPYPPLAHAVVLVSSLFVWSRSPSFQWAVCCLLPLVRSRGGLSPKAHCQKSISLLTCDGHCLEETKVA